MTVDDVKRWVESIRGIAGDSEAAHSEEDDLRHAVLLTIANGGEDATALAREALKTTEIKFSRWCA